MNPRSLLRIAAGAALLGALTGCSSLTRPDEITIQAEPPAQKPAEAAPGQQPARPAPAGAAQAQAGCGQ